MCGFSFKVGVLFWSGEGPFTLSSLILFFPLSCLSDWFDLFFESSVNYKYAYSPQVSQQSGPEFQGHFQLTGKLKNVNEVKVCTIKKTTGQMWMKTTPTPSLMVLPRVMTVRIPGRVGEENHIKVLLQSYFCLPFKINACLFGMRSFGFLQDNSLLGLCTASWSFSTGCLPRRQSFRHAVRPLQSYSLVYCLH